MTQEELIQKYKENEDAVKALQESQRDVLNQLKAFYPHKVGEIVKWTEKGRKRKIGGTMWHPDYEQLAKNHCYVDKDNMQWTGEIFKDYK